MDYLERLLRTERKIPLIECQESLFSLQSQEEWPNFLVSSFMISKKIQNPQVEVSLLQFVKERFFKESHSNPGFQVLSFNFSGFAFQSDLNFDILLFLLRSQAHQIKGLQLNFIRSTFTTPTSLVSMAKSFELLTASVVELTNLEEFSLNLSKTQILPSVQIKEILKWVFYSSNLKKVILTQRECAMAEDFCLNGVQTKMLKNTIVHLKLDFFWSKFDDSSANQLENFIKCCNSVKKLDLNFGRTELKNVASIYSAINQLKSLETLIFNLNFFNSTPRTQENLPQGPLSQGPGKDLKLISNSSIKQAEIYLAGNIQCEVLSLITSSQYQMVRLQVLKLDLAETMPQATPFICQLLEKISKCSPLSTLHITFASQTCRLQNLEGEDFMGLQHCTNLRELALYELNLKDDDIKKCLVAVFQLKKLQKLIIKSYQLSNWLLYLEQNLVVSLPFLTQVYFFYLEGEGKIKKIQDQLRQRKIHILMLDALNFFKPVHRKEMVLDIMKCYL